ncbi:hypothetical protein Cgig2_021439 [Carnegiea gigantea]|uniref:Uncharacterized protein n=1 Tax=Carnegiea gigantea TaxID=171969 RepID=A0A9Q1K4C1_9CARY|nr:hypothetical protein Cgig2_021439 [Carnegiea gigantea]
MHLVYLYKVRCPVTAEVSKAAPHYSPTNEEQTPQHENNSATAAIVTKSPTEKEQEKVSTPKEKSFYTTTLNRNICNDPISSEDEQMQAPPITEPEKQNVSAREESKVSEPEKTRMSPAGFVALMDKFNEAQKQAILDMDFRGFLELQVTELPWDLCKWLVDNFDPYPVTLYIISEKKIEITPMDVHLTLVLLIGRRKVEEFYEKKPKDPEHSEVLSTWRKECNLEDGTPKLIQMP